MSDFMHGPSVAVEAKGRRKTYLIAFLDDATRVIPYAVFTLPENTTLMPVFKQAIMRRGLTARIHAQLISTYRLTRIAALNRHLWKRPSRRLPC